MTIAGASATWTRAIFSAGRAAIGSIGLPRDANMKPVEHNAEIVAIGSAHDVPGGGPVLHPAAPGERLVADAHAALVGDVGELGEIRGRALGSSIASGETFEQRQSRRAPSSCIRSSFRAARSKLRRADRLGHRLEVAQRLQRDDLKPEIGGHRTRVARLAAEEGQIVLEDFDGAKAGPGRGGEFRLQRAAHADRGDRPSDIDEFSYIFVSIRDF